MVKKKNIAFCILASIFTCGIYSLFWMVSITDDINYISKDRNATSGIIALLLTLVTCGIYGIYWAYKMGERVDTINNNLSGQNNNNNSGIIYLLLSIFGITSIIVYAIIQDQINKFSDQISENE